MTDGKLGDSLASFTVDGYEGTPHDAAAGTSLAINEYPAKMAFSIPVVDGEDAVGYAVVEFSLANENKSLANITKSIVYVSAGVALFIVLVLTGISRFTIVRPLSRLLAAASKLGRGEQVEESELASGSNDEVGKLSQGFWQMVEAIRAREAEIAERNAMLDGRNRDMRAVLDHVGQGIVSVDRGGKLAAERSAIVDTWFPEVASATDIWDLLEPYAGKNFTDNHRFAWESLLDGLLPVELNLHQLPSNFEYEGKSYSIQYTLVPDSEDFEQALIVINDVTAEVEKLKSEVHQREIFAAFRHVMKNREAFMNFYNDTDSIIQELPSLTDPAIVKRQIHTIKGNSALYDQSSISTHCHHVENAMEERGGTATDIELQSIRNEWTALGLRLAPILRAQEDKDIHLTPLEQQALLHALEQGQSRSELAKVVASWIHTPVHKELSRIGDQASALARRLGKGELNVAIKGGDFRLDTASWKSFWMSLSHVIRNAIDHGIESPEDRQTQGKPERANLTIRATQDKTGITLDIADDGRGIDWSKIKDIAAKKGLPNQTQAHLQDALFADGLSTREEATELSGRGVGMAAVKQSVTELGGHIKVTSVIGKGTTFRFFLPAPSTTSSQSPSKQAG